LKIAVFIDLDNSEFGVPTTLNVQFDIGAVLEAIKERGEVITKVAYGDWKRSGDHGRAMAQHAVRMVQRQMTPGGDKNGADINLALDALEMAFTHLHINAFVIVGGRAFTSQVMQKNCTEFIAYENIVPEARPERSGRHQKHDKGDKPRSNGSQPIENSVALVKRALKVLTDREVTPQLGLLKSTLLQLDSSFSERDYGVGTFREFADKLAKQGLVSLKHQGRSTLVELPATGEPVAPPAAESEPANLTELLEQPDSVPPPTPASDASLGDGVALVRRVLAETTTPPRWPMYPRQFKQFLRTAQPDFDERRYGSIADLMRACQKDGLLRLERDRQGALRVFASGAAPRASVPHGWGRGDRDNGSDAVQEAPSVEAAAPVVDVTPEAVVDPDPQIVEAQVTAVVDEAGAEAPAPKAKRASKRKTAAKSAKSSTRAKNSKAKSRE
jgi:hypothetical protein